MSKFLRVPNGDYTVQVQPGGNIVLDVGQDNGIYGTVTVTGDLLVSGNTTTVDTQNVVIEDNIIVLNNGETGAGITLDESGIRIDRGSLTDAYIVFDEDLQWADPVTATTKNGQFVFKDHNQSIIGIRTNAISTGGGDLYLINSGTGVISVTGTNNYEEQIFAYSGGNLDITGGPNNDGVQDDDYIPNAKGVVDYINAYFAGVFQDKIEEGDTFVETKDFSVTTDPSVVQIGVDGVVSAEFYNNRIELNDVRISDTKIETTSSNESLILSAPGTGAVRVQDVLEISNQPTIDDGSSTPTAPNDGLRLYVDDRAVGGSGLYFVHSDTTRDEIISNNRALVYSMLF
jgi:hypothetical protein